MNPASAVTTATRVMRGDCMYQSLSSKGFVSFAGPAAGGATGAAGGRGPTGRGPLESAPAGGAGLRGLSVGPGAAPGVSKASPSEVPIRPTAGGWGAGS